MESEDEGNKPKQKNKTLHRIQKNISSYLNDPTPEKIKQINVNCHQTLRNHFASVEDLSFMPDSPSVFCSVGVDRKLLLWDIRKGNIPAQVVTDLHTSDINTVDWC